MKIDIVITSYHRLDFTWKCLTMLNKSTKTPHRVIVVDNGSDEETRDMLWDAQECGLINDLVLLEENRGLEPAKNIGLSLVRSELMVDSDNDIIVPHFESDGDWLSRLISLMSEDYAAIALPPQVFIGARKSEIFKDAPEVVERDFVGGSMRLMRTEAVRKVGGWRSNPKDMEEANRSEEKYICSKLRMEGYKVGYARDIECFHLFGDKDDAPWGYENGVEHYHRKIWPQPSDKLYGSYEEWKWRKNNE